ncbi:MAG: hypothetical protein IPN76_31605 [Saprospiraceae bacterium]|jgi:hypothetical protein|nr:hypothetical protein [Saprospiraceae bacterium]
MKIRHYAIVLTILVLAMAFFAFYVPGRKVPTNFTQGVFNGKMCGPGTLPCNPSGRPVMDGSKATFNSKIYVNRLNELVMEFNKEAVSEDLAKNEFENGFYNIYQEFRIIDKDLLKELGIADTVLIVPKGVYPVKKSWGKYIATFGREVEKSSTLND